MPLKNCPPHLPNHIYEKIALDVAPEGILNALLDICDTTEHVSLAKAFDDHCRGNAMLGPTVDVPDDERLGHVRPEKRTLKRLADELNMEPDEIARLIAFLCGEGTKTDGQLAEEWFQTEIVNGSGKAIEIAKRPTWFFRTPDNPHEPFLKDHCCLPWCLALPLWAKTPTNVPPTTEVACLGYQIAGSAINDPRVPTIMDAGYEAADFFWHPGGKTRPHAHGPETCSHQYEEVVAEPPRLAQVERIFRFKSMVV